MRAVPLALLARPTTRHTLDFAARSVLDGVGLESSVQTVLASRALRHSWEALHQMLAIRLEDPEVAATLAGLVTEVEADAPSARAFLFRQAWSAIDERPPRLDRAWWSEARREPYRSALAAAREALTRRASATELRPFDVAELVFARRLAIDEVAYVLGRSEAEVEAVLVDAEATARRHLGAAPPSRSGSLDDALLEAFALAPRAERPREHPLLEVGAVVAQRYRIERWLGTGGFADVYEAVDLDVPGHVVALKLVRRPSLNADARESALRELRLIASVTHPSVVQFKDHGWHLDRFFFVMPFYRGETLRERLARGPLSRVEARAVFVPLARALAALHRAGVRHQDVKPDNVFLARPHDGDEAEVLPVLLDLGVAARDAENVLAGTPSYLAPEVAARFAREPDPPTITGKADVFSLALTLRNALVPEEEEDVLAGAVDAFVRHRARRSLGAPKRRDLRYLRSSFERWLHLAPDERPSAEELARELAVLTAPEERRARRVATLRWGLPLLVMTLVVFGAVVFVLGREAELQRIEATQARELASLERLRAQEASERAARVRADLAESMARRRALEADVARLEEEYAAGRLTREELASKLAHAESALALVTTQSEETLARVQGELRRMRESRDLSLGELDRARESLRQEQERAGSLRDRNDALTHELEEARAASARARARMDELEQTLGALRLSLGVDAPAPVPASP
ncbi:MAG: protein kinase [Sandaracinus sp.]|nr:protein kinase [Sandaracinus sp.]MCB9622656.1 protein kinase [Sandaracinus sp.]MCB9632962.1 protein kinase [Sandaracinus sp.]